jgi:hypothetical protein
MMKKFFCIIACLFLTPAVLQADDSERLTVVELFTSQGCSSCPPADTILRSLRERPGILTLSWPVDYWDRLGWEDTFANPHNSMRQAAYNKRLGRGGVFTPQMVFDGLIQCVGSKNEQVRKRISAARAIDRIDVHPLISQNSSTLTVTLPETKIDGIITVRAVWYLGNATVAIGNGENRGRTLHYTNVVRESDMLEDWNGKAKTIAINIEDGLKAGADHFALLLQQDYYHGPIIGAGKIALTSVTGR